MSVLRKPAVMVGAVAFALAIGPALKSLGLPAADAATVAGVSSVSASPPTSSDTAPLGMHATAGASLNEVHPTGPVPADASNCDVTAKAVPIAAARVALRVTAPCHGKSALTVHHNGMMFTETTDADGRLQVAVPALAERAVFIVEFASGQGAVAVAHVPEVAGYDRLVLQWTGAADFQVHARAFNTHGGTQTHVWSGSAHLEGAETGPTTSGDVLRLGKARVLAPRRAEIYSVPTGGLTESGSTRLTVESRVTSETCGRDIALQSLIQRGKMRPRSRFVDVRMPDCTTVGGFMVLKNLFDDLMIARR